MLFIDGESSFCPSVLKPTHNCTYTYDSQYDSHLSFGFVTRSDDLNKFRSCSKKKHEFEITTIIIAQTQEFVVN